jgi:hypothetical protein
MNSKWLSVKVLGLALLASLCLMATTAATAQAGEFKVNGATFAAAGISSESIQGTIGETTFSVAWLGFEIKCEGATLSGQIFKGGTVNAQATFTKCVIPGFEKNCTVASKGQAPGTIRIEGAGEIVLHAGKHYAKFSSANFTTLLTSGALCPLMEEMVASGSAAIAFNSALTESVSQAFSAVTGKAEAALLKVGVQCAGEPAAILGSGGSVSLSGANAGKKWGFE